MKFIDDFFEKRRSDKEKAEEIKKKAEEILETEYWKEREKKELKKAKEMAKEGKVGYYVNNVKSNIGNIVKAGSKLEKKVGKIDNNLQSIDEKVLGKAPTLKTHTGYL